MEQEEEFGNVKNVVIKSVDGRPLTPEDEQATSLNFPMWFGEDLIKEINDKDLTVVIFKDVDNNVRIHLASDDVDLLCRVQNRFWKFA